MAEPARLAWKAPDKTEVERDTVIRIQDVSHQFTQQGRPIDALKSVSMTVRRGEFVSLVGPSGCGKTTLLNLVAGIERLQRGAILVNGGGPRAGAPGVSYMFARDALMPWRTAAENISVALELTRWPRRERRQAIDAVLRRVNLADYANAYRSQLSQGMRQRVALARTLVTNPTLLLMDEPYAALDALTRMQLQDELATLLANQAATVLFVTHDLSEAVALSDRVVILSKQPGVVKTDLPIDLPRPRSVKALQANPQFHALYERIWADFHREVQ